ncbi:Mono-functional DNA-alkylating methyl methanesulfonate N-term/CPSF A subunit region containing protein, putative [Angomonas deanei]|uniref:Mono-functional DNA-alkylating methyl methanesulfonate N-term/CPSF A subunit region containing protein, putative n=1 Tax=Angomonas deanei TaxID=59799 RepID=A0A7G2CA31_9TRYP|nr:Mono-functional DNA-alkylating methyl methanesulfonate N-term/CPSF A subunit region containing protein, putative [Angomonas deanei]
MLKIAALPSLPVSSITDSVSGNFSGITRREVVAVRQNVLTLYGEAQTSDSGEPALHTIASVSLNAPPVSVAVCRPADSPVDVLVLLFDNYHLSLLQFNPMTLKFETIGILQLDDRPCAKKSTSLDPILRVNSTSTHMAVLVNQCDLFVVPILRVSSKDAVATALADNNADSSPHQASKIELDDWGDESDDEQNTTSPKEETTTRSTVATVHSSVKGNLELDVAVILGTPLHVSTSEIKDYLQNVRDIQFVESSGEPLLTFLYERLPAWAGRVRLVKWKSGTVEAHMLTCSVLWTKITGAHSSPEKVLVISDVENISYSATHMVPLPSMGQVSSSVLCFAINTIFHVSTKSNTCVYINNNGKEEADSVRAGSVVARPMKWIGGATESVIRTNINFANATAFPLSSNNKGWDRILVVTEEDGTVVELTITTEGSSVEGLSCRVLVGEGFFASSICLLKDNILFFGSDKGDSNLVQLSDDDAPRSLQRFTGLGCVRSMEMIDSDGSKANLSNELDPSVETSPFADLFRNASVDPMPLRYNPAHRPKDLAVCCGHKSSGAISILRHTARDNLIRRVDMNAVSTFFLDGSLRKRERDADSTTVPLLVLSGVGFTLLFSVRSDSVQQVKGAAFADKQRTVLACELAWCGSILQVTEHDIRVLSKDGRKSLHEMPFGTAGPEGKSVLSAVAVAEASAVFILFSDHTLHQFTVNTDSEIASGGAPLQDVSAFCYAEKRNSLVVQRDKDLVFLAPKSLEEEIKFANFFTLPPVVVEGAQAAVETGLVLPRVEQIAVFEDHDPSQTTVTSTLVFILSTGELVTYLYLNGDGKSTPARLLKDVHYFLNVEPAKESVETIDEMKKMAEQREKLRLDTYKSRKASVRLTGFTNIGGLRGIYACGQQPAFLFYNKTVNKLEITPHGVHHPVRGFSTFKSRHIDNGYVYCCEGYVNIATVDKLGELFASGWWMKRIPLKETPHHLLYTPSIHGAYVVTSSPQPYTPRKASFDVHYMFNADGKLMPTADEPPDYVSAASGLRVPQNDRYKIQLFSCFTWALMDTMLLEENEKVLGATSVTIVRDTALDTVTKSSEAPVCVLGTGFPLGEDVTTRGRVILCTTRHEAGKHCLRILHSEPMRGPVTAVAGDSETIMVSIGGTIRAMQFDAVNHKLLTMAILSTGAYVTSLAVLRDYVVFGDIYQSTTFARFSADNHTLTVLGRDTSAVSVVFNDMLYSKDLFAVIASDADRNLYVHGYEPRVKSSEKGEAKVLQAALQLTGEYRIPGGSLVQYQRLTSPFRTSSSAAVYATNMGEIGFLVGFNRQMNVYLQHMAKIVDNGLQHPAGLTPRMFLGYNQEGVKVSLRGDSKVVYTPLLTALCELDGITKEKMIEKRIKLDTLLGIGSTIQREASIF